MKLPLFHHGYQGKHQRGQIPRQRTRDSAELSGADDLSSADEQEAREEQEQARNPMPGGDAA